LSRGTDNGVFSNFRNDTGYHGIWLYDDQGIRPPRPQTAKRDPKCPVQSEEVRPRLFTLEHGQLLA
jgi:hypothetical protein